MIYVLYGVHLVTCLFLIMVVLLQQGKGADLSAFAGGSTQAAFGARGAATLLHKLTVGFFVLFILTTLSISLIQNRQAASSVMAGAETAEEATDDDVATEADPPGTDDSAPGEGTPDATGEDGAADAQDETTDAPEEGTPDPGE